MEHRKNPTDDYKLEIVQGPEMTEEDLDTIAGICTKIIYNQIIKEQQSNSDHNPNENNDQSTSKVKTNNTHCT